MIFTGNAAIRIFICGANLALIPKAALVNNNAAKAGAPILTAMEKISADMERTLENMPD